MVGADRCDDPGRRVQQRAALVAFARSMGGELLGNVERVIPAPMELIVNQKTAKALGMTLPPLFLAQADEVIE